MRAELAVTALTYESNRYLLTRLIAKATRKLHRPNTRLQDTMNDAFGRFTCTQTGAPCRVTRAANSSEGNAARSTLQSSRFKSSPLLSQE